MSIAWHQAFAPAVSGWAGSYLRLKSGSAPVGNPAVRALPGFLRMLRQTCSHVCGHMGTTSSVATCTIHACAEVDFNSNWTRELKRPKQASGMSET